MARIKRLVIAGTHSGAGKTTVAIGLMAALTRRGLRVQPYKVGPDYIDAAYHHRATGIVSRNLDDWLLSPPILRYLFFRSAITADLALIEGVMGLYDGIGSSLDGSTAAVAKTLQSPVVLVVDASSMSTSAAAQVLGYQRFDPCINLQGVILNNVRPGQHYQAMREAIEHTTGLAVLGCLPPSQEVSLPSRHLGLVPVAEMTGMQERLQRLSLLVEQNLDLERLLALAEVAPPLAEPTLDEAVAGRETMPVRLAVAYDRAFNFYYQDNLDLLQQMGAEMVFFSPLEDPCIPDHADGVYLGGGFPEVFAAELAENRPMAESFRRLISGGMPCFAECGGLMYLCGSIVDQEGVSRPMTGVLAGSARLTRSRQRFGYVEVGLTASTILGEPGEAVRGHEFHHSVVEGIEAKPAYKVTSARGDRQWTCGYSVNNLLAGYPHLHFWSNPRLAANFLRSCRHYRNGVKPGER
ncbi:MAG: cobyrinate a,c-diamide synthase [Syntrophomonadaceae bacterium]|nr:cobyrinate a,c-diamide synthase [Syntrophomonadaceae bacterium]